MTYIPSVLAERAKRLKPCPFCGSTAHIDYNSDNSWPRVVECDNDDCEAMGPWGKKEHDHEQAMAYIVDGWNRRWSETNKGEQA